MKPDFTLALSSETIQLLHRVEGGWFVVGTVDAGDPEMADRMAALRARALGLGNGAPFGTKLLIPNEQIRYLALDTTRADEDDVRAALAGATPYPVSDLVYDFVTGGGRTYIAAVARQTLAEAEAFAVTHRMAPLSFCAAPEPFTYLGEAFFGPTRASRDILPFGTFLDRDAQPVTVIGHLDGGEVAEAASPHDVIPFLSEMTVTAAAPDQHGAVLTGEADEAADPLPQPSEDRERAVFAAVPASAEPDPASAVSGDRAESAPSQGGAQDDGRSISGGTADEIADAPVEAPATAAEAPTVSSAGNGASDGMAPGSNVPGLPADTEMAPPQQIRLGGAPRGEREEEASAKGAAEETEAAAPLFSARSRSAGPSTHLREGAARFAPGPTADRVSGDGSHPDAGTAPEPGAAATPPLGFASRRTPTIPPRPADAGPATAASRGGETEESDSAPVHAGFTTRRDPTNPPRRPAPVPAEARDDAVEHGREAVLEGAAPGFVSRREPTVPPVRPGTAAPTGLRAEPPVRPIVQPVPAPDAAPTAQGAQAGKPAAEPALAVLQPQEVAGRPAGPVVTADSLPGGPAPSLTADARLRAAATEDEGGLFARRRSAAAAVPAGPAPDLGAQASRVGGKPRYLGLILTVLLLVFMAAVAAMAAFSEDGLAWLFGRDRGQEIEIAVSPDLGETTAPTQPSAEATSTELPALPATAEAPRSQTPGGSPAAPAADSVPRLDPDSAPQTTAEAGAAGQERPAMGEVLSPDEARRRYAATGVWQRAPRLPLTPRTQVLGDLAEASVPDPVARSSVATLPTRASYTTDIVPLTPPPPPPPGVTFPRDEDGFILATPEGTVLPSGAVVYAGRPDLTPPVRGGLPEPEPLVEEDGLVVWAGSPSVEPPIRTGIPEEALPPEVAAAPVEEVVAAEEGLLVVAGTPPVTPPVRTGIPEAAAEPAVVADALPEGVIAAEDGLLVLAGAPPVQPPVRSGVPDAALSPEAAAPPAEDSVAADAEARAETEALPETEPQPETVAAATEAPDAGASVEEGLVVLDGPPPASPPARPVPEVALPTAPDGRPALVLTDDLVVLAGAPAVSPPVRVTPEPAPDAPEARTGAAASGAGQGEDAAETEPSDISAPEPDPVTIMAPDGLQLAAVRPTARPASLDVPAGVLLPTDPTLAGFRPQVRPSGLAPAPAPAPAEEPEPPAAPDPDTVLAAAIASAVQEASSVAASRIVDATPQAVRASARPDLRPRNFARVVDQARRNQQRQEAAAQQAAARQAPAVPRASAAAPSAPTPRSVGAAATTENAINLRRISLIGVYGTQSNRRALVRLGNGRYAKVQVGDRLDGGRVAAIGESHLDYTVRGRTARLQMPAG